MDSSAVNDTIGEEILCKLKEELESGICQELSAIWTELWDEEERIKRKHILAAECKKEIKEFLQEVYRNEKKVRDDYIVRIEELLNEMNELQQSLEITIPYEDVETLPLHIMAAKLNRKAEKYRVIRNQRLYLLNELTKKEAALCEKLGTIRQVVSKSEIPTKAELQFFENHIAVMEKEKLDRIVTFLEQKQVILKLYEALGIEPLLNFEKEVVSEEAVETFALTNENMTKLDELRKKLESQLEEAKQEVNELTEKLMLLWNYVGDTDEHKMEFLSQHEGCAVSVIKAFKEEIARCETKKRENISKIVERIRQVLVEEWDRCLIGREEREEFRPFNINCFTEDLCDLHELEIKRLKNFYRDNEQIFVLIAKHEKLFNELLDLENGCKNANRYQNRGGQLLQEEKKRKHITKELPVVEEELRNLLKKFAEDHGKAFTSFGVPMETILDEKWNTHFDQKSIEKLLRKNLDKKGRTPLGKRLCTTPCTSSANKISRLNCERVNSTTKYTTPKNPVRSVTVRRKKKICEDNEAQTTMILEPTYDEFQNALQCKVENSASNKRPLLRSTAINEIAPRVLMERNTPAKIKPVTPIKSTPGKVSPPLWSPTAMKTPMTVPRARRKSQMPRLTPSRNHRPIII